MKSKSEIAETIVQDILNDLTDRRGFRQEWDIVDQDIKTEIRNTWKGIVLKHLLKEKI